MQMVWMEILCNKKIVFLTQTVASDFLVIDF